MAPEAQPPVSTVRLTQIADDNKILASLVSESKPDTKDQSTPATTPFKFAVNSVIIQHTSEPRARAAGSDGPTPERRGMHSAMGAYWNNEKDGMWSHKYQGAESKGMDIIISLVWIAI